MQSDIILLNGSASDETHADRPSCSQPAILSQRSNVSEKPQDDTIRRHLTGSAHADANGPHSRPANLSQCKIDGSVVSHRHSENECQLIKVWRRKPDWFARLSIPTISVHASTSDIGYSQKGTCASTPKRNRVINAFSSLLVPNMEETSSYFHADLAVLNGTIGP